MTADTSFVTVGAVLADGGEGHAVACRTVADRAVFAVERREERAPRRPSARPGP